MSRRVRLLPVLSLLLALTACQEESGPPGADAFDFMEGSWTTLVDGLSLTLDVREAPDGDGWLERRILDDGNHLMETARLSFDASTGEWTRQGMRGADETVWRGGPDGAGEIVLVAGAAGGEGSDADQQGAPRMIIRRAAETDDEFTLEVQGVDVHAGEGSPVASPGTYRRVDRPAVASREERIAFISNRSGDWEVYSMSPTGEDVRNLSRDKAEDHFPRWIAGGTRLSFRSQRSRDDGAWDRWEVDADGSDATRIAITERLSQPEAGEFPEVHPSGAFVVNAVERNGEQDIRIWRRDGSDERVLAPAPGIDYRPLFSPDGSRILFISERDGNAEIYTVEFDGSDVRRLTDAPGIDRYARWSPDGTRIGFVSDRDGDLEVYVMRADGTGLRQLTHNEAQDGEISWSPDGMRIAYRSDVEGEGEIHVVHVETGEVVNLTRHEAYDGEPVWSPAATPMRLRPARVSEVPAGR